LNTTVDSATLPWQPVRPDLTEGVWGRTLRESNPRVVLTRVEPQGRFRPHRDPYGHLFIGLEGAGVVTLEGEEMPLSAGTCVHIDPGSEHGYANPFDSDLLLLSLNLPQDQGLD